jgi:hypothetical protein
MMTPTLENILYIIYKNWQEEKVIKIPFILSQAFPRLLNPQHSNAGGMVVIALIGITVNGFAALRL